MTADMPTGQYIHRSYAVRIQKQCPICHAIKIFTPGQLRAQGFVYCSQRCHGIANLSPQSHVLLTCSICGKDFERFARQLRSRNVCSIGCLADSRKRTQAKWRDKTYIKHYMRMYSIKHRKQINTVRRRYKKLHRATFNLQQRKRRSAGNGLGRVRSLYQKIIAQAGLCAICETTQRLEIDHIIALSRGGQDLESNYQVLCRSCNARKGNR